MPDQLVRRSYVPGDFAIRSDGEGRTVQAYAAVFNTPAEIKDSEGHYTEVLTPGCFARSIADHVSEARPLAVFYNHARDLYGTPSGTLSVPIGVPMLVREDTIGVYTETRYLDTPLADAVLAGIKAGAIRGQSFSGRFLKTKRTPGVRGGLPTFSRTEITMKEYGPTVFPAYVQAKILGTRTSATYLQRFAELEPDAMAHLFRQLMG